MKERTIKKVNGKGKIPTADLRKAIKKVKEGRDENNNSVKRKSKAKTSE